jgi:hypothetical protein
MQLAHLSTKIIDPVHLTMSEMFKALDSINHLIKELFGLFLSLSMVFIVSIQFPEASLSATELKAR